MGEVGEALATDLISGDINDVNNTCMYVCTVVNVNVNVNVHVYSKTARVVEEALTSAKVRGKLIYAHLQSPDSLAICS